jgi:hypothetical protein
MRKIKSPFARLAVVLVAVFGLLAITTPAGASIDNLTIMPSPSPGANFNNLESVSCVTASSCVAVGHNASTFVLSWNGMTWTSVTSPSPGENGGYLYSVSCVNSSWCVAVGAHTINNEATYQTMIQVWDGRPRPQPRRLRRLTRLCLRLRVDRP